MSPAVDIPRCVKVLIGFHLLSFALWIVGQTGAVFVYDTVSAWGFQAPRTLSDPAIVETNRAIGLTDTVIMLPLLIVAAVEKAYVYPSCGPLAYYTYYWGFFIYWGILSLIYTLYRLAG